MIIGIGNEQNYRTAEPTFYSGVVYYTVVSIVIPWYFDSIVILPVVNVISVSIVFVYSVIIYAYSAGKFAKLYTVATSLFIL